MFLRPLHLLLLSFLAVLLAACPGGRGRGGDDDDAAEDDDDSGATDDDDAGDDDDATDDDDAGDDDDAAGPELVYASGTYRWFNDLAQALNDQGYDDCHHTWDVEATAGTPASGCPGCSVVSRVDFLWSGTDCDSALFDPELDFPNVELGVAGGSMYQYNGSAWATFMTGDGTSTSWSGESDSIDYGQYLRIQLIDVGWE
jgi:hypothetical protein